MKPINTLRNLLVKPKDRTPMEKHSCIIYQLTCDQDPNHTYIGETKRTLQTRFNEHQKLDRPTAIGEHSVESGHTTSLKNARIMGKEENWHARKIKEAIKIRTQRPQLNRDVGIQLSHVYDQLLHNHTEARNINNH